MTVPDDFHAGCSNGILGSSRRTASASSPTYQFAMSRHFELIVVGLTAMQHARSDGG